MFGGKIATKLLSVQQYDPLYADSRPHVSPFAQRLRAEIFAMSLRRRPIHLALHWTQFSLLLGLISTQNPTAFWAVAYAIPALAWPTLALFAGLHGRGGAKLGVKGRAVHQWHHRLLYLLTAASGVLALAWAWGQSLSLQYWLFLLFMVSNLHAVFHLWRHTALRDGALFMITPRALHKLL